MFPDDIFGSIHVKNDIIKLRQLIIPNQSPEHLFNIRSWILTNSVLVKDIGLIVYLPFTDRHGSV